jgi:polyhydroxybutyrate depolymerase
MSRTAMRLDYFRNSAFAIPAICLAVVVYSLEVAANSDSAVSEGSSLKSKDVRGQFLFGGRQRTYLLHVPPSYRMDHEAPLVVVLHGGGGNADNVARMSRMSEKADEQGFLVVYPNGTGKLQDRLLTWNSSNCCGYALDNNVDDVGFIAATIARIEKDYRIDSARIFATGISNGGMMCYRLACELSTVIVAIAPVAGAMNIENCAPTKPVSVVIFHGTADGHVPYDGGRGTKRADTHDRIDHSVHFAASFWAEHNDCSTVFTKEQEGNILRETFPKGTNGSEVVVYTINGGTHSWPGGTRGSIFGDKPSAEISATDLMWEFFSLHPRRQ